MQVPLKNTLAPFSIVVALNEQYGIGFQNRLPWDVPADMKHFVDITQNHSGSGTAAHSQKQNVVIMGYNTWRSIGQKKLAGRLNVVIRRIESKATEKNTMSKNDADFYFPSLRDALETFAGSTYERVVGNVFVIGGAKLFGEAMQLHPWMTRLYLTWLQVLDAKVVTCFDSHFPMNLEWIRQRYRLHESTVSQTPGHLVFAQQQQKESMFRMRTETWVRQESFVDHHGLQTVEPHPELQYLSLVRDVLDTGIVKSDRTGVGTVSKFGAQMRFSLRNGTFPLLTTKRVFWKGVVEELLWMLSGSTNSQLLNAKKVTIWNDNGSRAFLDNLGFTHRAEGDLGPVYGFQWRHFGATYTTATADYKGQGTDQIADVMHQIKTNPDSRRIVMSAWNPSDLKQMALPPCHMSAQFTVANGELSCMMTQRSADIGLGLPFNIASYALLTVLMAHACGLKPGEFVHVLGDYHIYTSHIPALVEQLKRTPKPFPTLKIRSACAPQSDLSNYTMADLELLNYQPHESIKMTMAV